MNRSMKFAACAFALAGATTLGVLGRTAQPVVSTRGLRATEANITRLSADILGQSQFAHHPLDAELSAKFLDGYLDALDGTHTLLTDADVAEFQKYRAALAQATRREGDTTPAHVIFARYLERLGQRSTYVAEQLRSAKFDFTGHDTWLLVRSHSPRPHDLDAARALWLGQLRAEYLQEKLSNTAEDQIKKRLAGRYARQLETMKGLHDDEVLEVYLNALAHVYDPHSDYLGHEQMESLSISMNLSLFGIGASLENADGYCTIRELIPGGPAAKSGSLKPGDRIVAVTQAGKEAVDVVDMPLSRTVELIRGPKGSTVTLTILPAGAREGAAPKAVSLVRDQVKLDDQRAKARIVDLPRATGKPMRLGVIELPEFYADMSEKGEGNHASATADVARLLTKLKTENVQGVVVDLRENGGGSLMEAISLTGLFIDKGPIVQTRGATGAVEVDADPDPRVLWDGPLVLLTSRFSASASEIMTGALQDYGRALVVGDTSTFGKGTVQTILQLARVMDQSGLSHAYDPGALKVTIRKFYRPGGASTQLKGVASDIVLPSASDFADVSESSLKDPLPWDSVRPTLFDRQNRVTPHVDALRAKSAKRVGSDEEFSYLRDEVRRMQKSLAAKSVSLNEADRRKEMAESTARKAAHDRKLAALHPKRPTVYELTVDEAAAAGLPPASHWVDPPKTASGDTKDPAVASAESKPPGNRAIMPDASLDEGTRILADYVDLVAGAARRR